jgi:1-acylglycerone phosphate reductase
MFRTDVFRPAVEMDFEETKGMFAVNVLGVMAMNQTFFPRLLAAKGTIINCGSIGGVLPLPFDAAYSATKAALYAYSETLRIELAPFGVKVTYVQTGAVKTNLLRHKPALKEDSIYIPIKQRWEEKQEVLATSGVDPADFAKEFTHRVVGGHTDVFWIGQDTFNVRMINMLSKYLFFNPWSMIFSKDYQLNKLKVV